MKAFTLSTEKLKEQTTSVKTIDLRIDKKEFEIFTEDCTCIIDEVEFVKIIDLSTEMPLPVVTDPETTTKIIQLNGISKFLSRILNHKGHKNLFFPILLVITLGNIFGQTTLFSDNFTTSQGTTFTINNGNIGSSIWKTQRSGSDWGARITNGILELTNDATVSINANGSIFAYRELSGVSGYNPILSQNTGMITWEFNMRQIRTDPSGFTSSSTYGSAFVLAANNTNVTSGNTARGYAVILGESGTTDRVRLVRFIDGIEDVADVTVLATSNTIGLTDFGTEYVSIRVTYTPGNNTWQLFLRNDGTTAFTDPNAGSPLVLQGSAVNSSETNISLGFMGPYWKGSTQASQTAFFDNIYLKGPSSPSAPTITSITPSNGQLTVNFTAPASNGGATITNYKYSIDNGTTFTAVSPSQTSSPIFINGLTNGTTYNVLIRAVNALGDGIVSNLIQGTPINAIVLPVVESLIVSAITTTSATLGASITSNGGELLSARGTVWGTSPNPTGNVLAEGGNGIGSFSHSRTGFVPNTFYYYRGYATNSAGTSYSADATLTTRQNAPTVGSGSGATNSAFTTNWSAPTGGGSASFTYEVQISTSPTFATTLSTQSNISSLTFSRQFTGLTEGTTYYFRVRANNAGGSSAWSNISIGYTTLFNRISLNTMGTVVAENFNSLSSTGSFNTITPIGWYFFDDDINDIGGGNGDDSYMTGTGTSSQGDVYSFGSTSSDRSFGGLGTGSCTPIVGAKIGNLTGSTITNLSISYFGETWRVGASNRSDRLDFQYSLNATSLTTGTWIDVNSLDYANPGQATGSGSLLHSQNISNAITGLSIPNGTTFWIRLQDFGVSGSDDGMGIDDFTIRPCVTTSISSQPSSNSQETCQNSSQFNALSLTALGTGLSYQWQSSPLSDFSASVLNVGTNIDSYLPVNSISGTLYYRCVITNSCGVQTNSAISGAFAVNPIPNPPTSSSQSFCSAATPTVANLTASGTNIQWYSTSSGGTALASGAALATGTYYASQTISGCESNTRSATSITINTDGTWVGGSSGNWNVSGNWCGGVPNSNTAVVSVPGDVVVNLDSSPSVLNLTIAAGATLNGGSNTLTIANSGSFTNNGTFNAGTGTITFNGTGTLSGNAISFNNLSTNGNLMLTVSPIVNGALTLNSGTLTIGSNTLTLNGSIISNSGNINASNSLSNVVFSGTTAQTIPSSSFIGDISNLTLNNISGLNLNQDITVSNLLTVTNGSLNLGSANLVIGTSGSISIPNPSASNLILTSGTGELRKRFSTGINQNPEGFLFPVGTLGSYTPVHLDFTNANFGSEAYLRVRVEPTKSSNLSSSITSYLNRNWIIEPNDISNYTYDIRLKYNASDFVAGGLTEDELIPIKYSNGQWNQPAGLIEPFTNATNESSNYFLFGGSSTDPVFNSNRVILWGGLQSFSEFGGAGQTGQPLPVELISFKASCLEEQNVLTWQTASEHNSSHFNIEKSRDGEIWNVIGKKEAAGNSNELLTYQFVDSENNNATIYYRLNQVDFDGKSEYFGPATTDCYASNFVASTLPNPSNGNFWVKIQSNEPSSAVLSIVDVKGNNLFSNEIIVQEGINLYQINSFLDTGIYFIHIYNSKDQKTTILKHLQN